MSKHNMVETLVGMVIITIACCFFYFAYTTNNVASGIDSGYNIIAKFDRADGLNPGSDVKIGGVKIGKVLDLSLDLKSYHAVAKLQVKKDIWLPVDSTAEIIGNGLLGEKYISIIPGSESDHIANNGMIEFTQSSISLESLIGKFIFGNTSKNAEATPDKK